MSKRKFKVGDKVQIATKLSKSDGNVSSMLKTAGFTGRITNFYTSQRSSRTRYLVELDQNIKGQCNSWYYAARDLVLLKEKSQPKPIFKVGDYVVVTGKHPKNDGHKMASWIASMDKTVGAIGKVTAVSGDYITTDHGWHYVPENLKYIAGPSDYKALYEATKKALDLEKARSARLEVDVLALQGALRIEKTISQKSLKKLEHAKLALAHLKLIEN